MEVNHDKKDLIKKSKRKSLRYHWEVKPNNGNMKN